MFGLVTVSMIVIGVITDSRLLIEFSLLLGAIAFIMELIPQIGPILSYIPALILAIASGPLAIVLVSIFYFVIFNIEGSILVPTFEGRMINFTGASVLVLIAIGFALGGIIGAILALPLASIARDLFRLANVRSIGYAGLEVVPRGWPRGGAGEARCRGSAIAPGGCRAVVARGCAPSLSTVHHTRPGPGHWAVPMSASMRSAYRAGYAAARNSPYSPTMCRADCVERSRSSRETTSGPAWDSPLLSSPRKAARASAFIVAHRTCCSRRRSCDCASQATIAGSLVSSSTRSMTPRARPWTGTSMERPQRG